MTKPLLTVRTTIVTRPGAEPVVLEISSKPITNPTPTRVAEAIETAFSKMRKAVEEELL